MPSTPPPPHFEESQTNMITKFNNLLTYASTRGTYLLQDSQFRMFETTYETSHTLNSILLQFTTPTAFQNAHAIRQLRSLQICLFRQAQTAYERLVTPRLLQRINRNHYPEQRNSPSPMRILTPPISLSPRFAPSNPPTRHTTSFTRTTNNGTRNNPLRRCFKCHQTSHTKRDCPRYRCMSCRQLQPGHLTNNCPNQFSGYHEQDFNDDYDPDGNLNGEQ
jgi:hypothetical protein